METKYMYEMLLEMGVNEQILAWAISMTGYNEETMESILFAKYGYHNFDEMWQEEEALSGW